jgi:hypothetical protein
MGPPVLVLLYYLSLLTAPLLLPLANTVYGVAHVISAGGSIAREREQQTYDVLCAAPAGVLGMHWSYCTGWIHAHGFYRYAMLGILSIGIAASVFGLSPQVVFGVEPVPLGVTIIRALALGALFTIDYAQTVVLSSLTILLLPGNTEDRSNARFWVTSLFLALQLGIYLPTLMLGVYGLPILFALVGIDPVAGGVLMPLFLLGFFVALRETIIAVMWRAVHQQLTTSSMELDAITRRAV